MIIYKITNQLNDKVYIGQTIRSFKTRIYAHKKQAIERRLPIQRAIYKYGFENFKFEILCECINQNDLDNMEIFYIWAHGSTNPELGYNLENGGNKSSKITDEIRHRMSLAQKKRYQNPEMREQTSNAAKKRFNNPNEREKLRQANLGKILSEETKQKIRDNHFDWTGKKHTKESKEKMKQSHLGKRRGENNSSAKLNWEIVSKIREEYEANNISQSQLALKYGVDQTTISCIIKFKTWKTINNI